MSRYCLAAVGIAGALPAQQVDTHSIPAQSKYNLQSFVGKRPLTRAERTNFTETSHYDDVVVFIDSLKKLGAKIATGSIAKTFEGRELPYVIASRPLITTPAEARRLNRPVAYIQANIHAGEIEGKEAMQSMLRDLLFDKKKNVLDSIVLIVQPIYNADGNEKWGPQERNRGAQNGPELVGTRQNASGLESQSRLHRRRRAGDQGRVRDAQQVESRSVHGSPHHRRQHPRLRADLRAAAHADGGERASVRRRTRCFPEIRKRMLERDGFEIDRLRRLQPARSGARRPWRGGGRGARRAGGGRGADSAAGRGAVAVRWWRWRSAAAASVARADDRRLDSAERLGVLDATNRSRATARTTTDCAIASRFSARRSRTIRWLVASRRRTTS